MKQLVCLAVGRMLTPAVQLGHALMQIGINRRAEVFTGRLGLSLCLDVTPLTHVTLPFDSAARTCNE